MRTENISRMIGVVTLLWCIGWSNDILLAWLHAPYDQYAWILFLGWLATGPSTRPLQPPRMEWLIAAHLMTTMGIILQVNALLYAGAATALVAWTHGRLILQTLWLITAWTWMPLFGWLFKSIGIQGILLMRVTGWMIWFGIYWLSSSPNENKTTH